MKHRIAALMAALCIVAVFAAPATAVQRGETAEPALAPAVEAQCEPFNTGPQSGMESSTSNISATRSGALAYINPSDTGFDICNEYIANSGPSAWVAIQPKVAQTNDPFHEIIQLGIIECGGGWYTSYCQGENNPHYVLAFGNCVTSKIVDLGPADLNGHWYSIYLDYDNKWHFSIDGVQRYTLSRSYTGCWDTSLRKAVFGAERFNGGDSVGDPSAKTSFTEMRYGVYGQGWYSTNFYSGGTLPCQKQASDDTCYVSGYDNMYVGTNN